jgi:hypothetical protein
MIAEYRGVARGEQPGVPRTHPIRGNVSAAAA